MPALPRWYAKSWRKELSFEVLFLNILSVISVSSVPSNEMSLAYKKQVIRIHSFYPDKKHFTEIKHKK